MGLHYYEFQPPILFLFILYFVQTYLEYLLSFRLHAQNTLLMGFKFSLITPDQWSISKDCVLLSGLMQLQETYEEQKNGWTCHRRSYGNKVGIIEVYNQYLNVYMYAL